MKPINIRAIMFILFVCFSGIYAFSQVPQSEITYYYDNSGNRISRKVITIISTPLERQSQNEKRDSLNSFEANNFDSEIEIEEKSLEDFYSEKLGNISVSVFPNPTSKNLIYSQPENTTSRISIFNLNGQLLEDIEISVSTYEIDMSKLAVGTYMVRSLFRDEHRDWLVVKNE